MRRNKAGIILTSVLCFFIIAGLGCSAVSPSAPVQKRRVALVAKSTQTEFWKSVFAGAEAAAAEYNLELVISGPETEEDYEAQNQLVRQAVAGGAEALVFSAIDFENNASTIDAAADAGADHGRAGDERQLDGVRALLHAGVDVHADAGGDECRCPRRARTPEAGGPAERPGLVGRRAGVPGLHRHDRRCAWFG